jgi:hypothetical protein
MGLMRSRSVVVAAMMLVACSSSSAPGGTASDSGTIGDATAPGDAAPPGDAAAAGDGGVTVGEFLCAGKGTVTTTQPPGVPPQTYTIRSFLSTVITNADGTLTAYSGTDASGNCIFQYAKPVGGVAALMTPLTCPGPVADTTATYTSGTSTVGATTSSLTLDADLTGTADASLTMGKLVDRLSCVKM